MWLNRSQLIEALDCKVLVDPVDREAMVETITWDSRDVVPGGAFLAIKGERVDGNSFIAQVIGAGASFVIATGEPTPDVLDSARSLDVGIVLVTDHLKAMRDLADYARRKMSATVIGVTGSSGKTTTKNMISHVLSVEFETVATAANQNNELGVPATLLAAGQNTEMLVVEMGMRGFGQLKSMCSFVRPKIGVITNIGTAHEELLGSQDNIAKAKSEMLESLPDETGLAILNGDDPFTSKLCEYGHLNERGVGVIRFGISDGCDVRGMNVEFDSMGMPSFDIRFPDGRTGHVNLPLGGMHNVMDALSAAAVGFACDIPAERICNALASVEGQSMRQDVLETADGTVIIDDTYNANPDSMRAALSMMSMMKTDGKRVAVLGDMGELGDREVQAHESIGQAVYEFGIDLLVTVGGLAHHIAAGATAAGMAPDAVVKCLDVAEALTALEDRLAPGDLVLVKASRFMELERVVRGLIEPSRQ